MQDIKNLDDKCNYSWKDDTTDTSNYLYTSLIKANSVVKRYFSEYERKGRAPKILSFIQKQSSIITQLNKLAVVIDVVGEANQKTLQGDFEDFYSELNIEQQNIVESFGKHFSSIEEGILKQNVSRSDLLQDAFKMVVRNC